MSVQQINPGEVTTILSNAAAGVVTGETFAAVKHSGHASAFRVYSFGLFPDAAVTVTLECSFDGITWIEEVTLFTAIAIPTISNGISILAPLFRVKQTIHATAGQVTVQVYT